MSQQTDPACNSALPSDIIPFTRQEMDQLHRQLLPLLSLLREKLGYTPLKPERPKRPRT